MMQNCRGVVPSFFLGVYLLLQLFQGAHAAWVSSFSCQQQKLFPQRHTRTNRVTTTTRRKRLAAAAAPTTTPTSTPLPGADIEPPPEELAALAVAARPEATLPPSAVPSQLTTLLRGKVNEIDFCIAPADVSLSRAYSNAASSATITTTADIPTEEASSPSSSRNGAAADSMTSTTRVSSLTRFLNNASNRAVRRILLARSWPSAEALNLSLRRAAEQQRLSASLLSSLTSSGEEEPKCPVPRPILNILMRRWGGPEDATSSSSSTTGSSSGSSSLPASGPVPRSRTDEEYVADQLKAFRERYGAVPGYALAEAYLECILSLATSGIESPRLKEVIESGVYDESYRRVKNVLKSVGAVFEPAEEAVGRFKIASKLLDQDFCLSMLDKINLRREIVVDNSGVDKNGVKSKSVAKGKDGAKLTGAATKTFTESGANGDAQDSLPIADVSEAPPQVEEKKARKVGLKFWKLLRRGGKDSATTGDQQDESTDEDAEEEEITRDDLGAVLLSSEEPSVTRQLNVLSNIVHRALLFGGDQELLVLSETLDADLPAFVERWYPGTGGPIAVLDKVHDEQRPGVQYYNCLVELLKTCYRDGVIRSLDPPLPLIASYGNAYERLTASLLELGSGYIKPFTNVMTLPKPRNAQEELGRFAVWETTFRKTGTPDITLFPEDMVGSWEVKDEIGGKIIGVSTVVFLPDGHVQVAAPMEGLRWRLDPGPTHLDTCTFQVLNDDGTVLQYRGFVDRGARLEARFSGRSIKIRGSVMFQMRDGDAASSMTDDYWKDMLPINYRTGTTKFVMTRNSDDKR